jgi:hypothetical protein
MAETLSTRVTRLERAMAEIAEKHSRLDDLVSVLLDAQIKTEKRFQQTDERIGKLVSAIGEFMRSKS